MKRLIGNVACVSICFAFLLFFFARDGGGATQAQPINIGVVISVTGPYGFIGAPQKQVIEAAIEDVNKKGGIGGRPLRVFIEDDKSVPTNAVVAGTKLMRDRGVCALLAASSSDASSALIPMAEQEKVPYLAMAPVKNPNKPFIFMVGPGDIKSAMHYAEYGFKDMGAKRVALLSETGQYGKVGSDTILSEVKKYPGASIVIHEKMEVTDTNAVPQLTKIKAANADLLMFYGTAATAAVVVKNYKQLGMSVPVLGSNAITIPTFLKLAGDAAEEMKWIYFSQPFIVAERMKADDPFRKTLYDPFKKMMQEAYGPSMIPNLFHASAYDCVVGLVAALKLAGTDNRSAIRDALEKINVPGFLGGFAPTPQDHYGSPRDPMIPLILKGGEWVPYDR